MSTPPGVMVHPMALCESDTVGAGTRIWPFAHVMAGAVVGRDCNIGGGAFIESGARLGDRVTVKNGCLVWDRVSIADDVFVGPAVTFTNDLRPRAHRHLDAEDLLPTVVERGATLGANATVVCGTTIGADAFVAAGAVVVSNVRPQALMAGNPARCIGWVCPCGERLDAAGRCLRCNTVPKSQSPFRAASGALQGRIPSSPGDPAA